MVENTDLSHEVDKVDPHELPAGGLHQQELPQTQARPSDPAVSQDKALSPEGVSQVTKHPVALRNGIAAPTTVEDQYRIAKLYLQSKMLPDRFKTPEQIVTALHFANEHFPDAPLTALRQIAVIDGVPAMFGDLPLAKVLKSGLLIGKEEYFLDDKQQRICPENKNLGAPVWAAVCTTIRRNPGGTAITHTTIFTMDDAKRARLADKNVWKSYPQDMIKYKARGRNLKDQFADALAGAAQGEFDFDMRLDDATRATATPSIADQLNDHYLEKK